MTNLGMTAEGQMIQVDVADMNLDIGRLRFSYEAGDKAYRMVEPVPGGPTFIAFRRRRCAPA